VGKAHKAQYEALTSIHLDMNKRSDLVPGLDLKGKSRVSQRLEDIKIPSNLLSRFDYIVDIPRDVERQLNVALEMFKGRESRKEPSSIKRELQLIVACLRDAHPEISTEEVDQYMFRAWREIISTHNDYIRKSDFVSDYVTRANRSFYKFVHSIARLNGRSQATESDVDTALPFIQAKFDFVVSLIEEREPLAIEAGDETEEDVTVERTQEQKRFYWIFMNFPGREVTIEEVMNAWNEQGEGPKVGERTVRRNLDKIGQKRSRGKWYISPSLYMVEAPSTPEKEEAFDRVRELWKRWHKGEQSPELMEELKGKPYYLDSDMLEEIKNEVGPLKDGVIVL
jgi:hypothetical protein